MGVSGILGSRNGETRAGYHPCAGFCIHHLYRLGEDMGLSLTEQPDLFTPASGLSEAALCHPSGARGFFAETDRKGAANVAVINEAMAAQVWPGRDALGQCFNITDLEGCLTVIGIVPNARMTQLADDAPPQLFIPITQWHPDWRTLMVRLATTDEGSAIPAVRRAILTAEPTLPYVDVRPMSEIVDAQVETWKLGAAMFTLFGALGVIVAALGLYSVIAHDVTQRRREMGVRMALGARREDVARLVVGSGVRQAIAGMALGLVIAWAVSTRVSDLLFQTSPRDPWIYGSVVALLLMVAILASFIPARRASKLDPADVLRDS